MRNQTNVPWDAIVLGSGMGGLTTAVLLAKGANQRVLVLEKHTQPGGLTHVFRREGASWDVGLHYVGDLSPGLMTRTVMDAVTSRTVTWRPLPQDFEHFHFPDFQIDQPADHGKWKQRLVRAFPHEEKGIQRWFREMDRVGRWNQLGFVASLVPGPIAAVVRGLQRLGRGVARRTTKQVVEACVTDPRLRDLLTVVWGDYGLPPDESSVAIHAVIENHYRRGAWFPEGGSGRIARAAIDAIESRGGRVLTGWEALEVLRDPQGAVRGVRARDVGNGSTAVVEFSSPVVVSALGVANTLGRLVKGPLPRRTARLKAAVEAVPRGHSAVTVYLKLRASAATLGVKGENWWIRGGQGGAHQVYLSFPSLKNGDERFHTAEVIRFVATDSFVRGEGYLEAKERCADEMLALVEEALPGFGALVCFREVSTPLTVEDYISQPRGEFYGLPARPERYAIEDLQPRTGIPGLYLSGQDVGCLGIVGAMMGGAGAAATILGPKAMPLILRAASMPAGTAPRDRATVVSVVPKTPTVREVTFDIDSPWSWRPGQYARFEVAPGEWRDYSVVHLEPTPTGCRATFWISTVSGGDGSLWFGRAREGDSLRVEGPMGTFGLVDSGAVQRVFIATGTGLAPLVPLIAATPQAWVVFGCRSPEDDLTRGRVAEATVCYSRVSPDGQPTRRVTDALVPLPYPADAEYYVCGSPAMVRDVTRALRRQGVTQILTEKW